MKVAQGGRKAHRDSSLILNSVGSTQNIDSEFHMSFISVSSHNPKHSGS